MLLKLETPIQVKKCNSSNNLPILMDVSHVCRSIMSKRFSTSFYLSFAPPPPNFTTPGISPAHEILPADYQYVVVHRLGMVDQLLSTKEFLKET